jgi:hypothetical protein
LVIAMHGTGGNEGTLFDGDSYKQGALEGGLRRKHEMLVVSPLGRGVTEYRGIGENDVFEVMEAGAVTVSGGPGADLSYGHSMGGTGRRIWLCITRICLLLLLRWRLRIAFPGWLGMQ